MLLGYAEPAEFGLETVDGVPAGLAAGEAGGEHQA